MTSENLLSFSIWGCGQKVPSVGQEESSHQKPNCAGILVLVVQLPACEKIKFCCLSYLSYGILLWQPKLTSMMYVLVTQSGPTLFDPMDCSSPSSSVHGILQARILKWVAFPFSRRSSQSRNQTQVSCIAGSFFTIWATGTYNIFT